MKEPPGGHHFVTMGVTIRDENFNNLIDKVIEFKVTNNLPYGNPEQEVLHFYAEHWPYLVERTKDTFQPEDSNYSKWRDWIRSTWAKPPVKSVAKIEAETRAKICAKCPFNRPENFGNSPEAEDLRKRAFLLRKGVDVPPGLGYCAIHRCDLSAFVFIDNANDFSGRKKGGSPVKDCWVWQS